MPQPAWPSVARQLTEAKAPPSSALEKLIQDNQDFHLLRLEEANDKIGLPQWLRVYWRKQHPEGVYSANDPTGGYPRALKNVHAWMLAHPDLKPDPPANPVAVAAAPAAPVAPEAPKALVAVGSNLQISGAQVTSRSESDIRVNYNSPNNIIAASNAIGPSTQAQFYSSDGGATWGQTSLPPVPGDSFQSDPAVDWTSDGTAWAIAIGIDASQTNLQLRSFRSSTGGATWAFDATISGAQTAADKEMMWVDHSPTSPFKDNIYVIWHTNQPAFVNRRTGPAGAWQTPIQVSGAETTGTGIGGDIKTNSSGDVFAFWPDTGSRRLLVAKSTNGGASFAVPVTIAAPPTYRYASFDIGVPSFDSRRALIYVSGGAYRTATKDLVYAIWTDLTGVVDPTGVLSCNTSANEPGASATSPCTTRIWFSRSTDGGATWEASRMINNQASLNDQFNPWLVVDETDGRLVVIYYDTVGDPGRLKTDVWYQTSSDDGVTWSPAVKVTTAQTDETVAGADLGNQYGDYNGLSGYAGTFFPSWTDRRSGSQEEIWTAPITTAVGNLHVVGLTGDGKLWHTIRFANSSWQPFFGDVKAQESNDPGPFTTVGCAGAGGDLHVVGLTGDGKLWHTIRFANSSWQPFFGDVKAQESNDPGPFTTVGCAGAGGDLHVVGLTGDGKLWHTIRFANSSWQPFFGDVKAQESNDPGPFTTVGCAGAGGDLHVVGLTGDGKLWHTIRFANSSWQPFFGDVKAQESNDPGPFTTVGCAGAGGDLHVVGLTGDGKLWHTIRFANSSWQPFFGDVKAQESNDPGPFTDHISCAGTDGDLQFVGVTGDGKLWHTIRFANSSWQSFFGDVKAQESNDPGPFIPVGIGGI